MNQATISSNGVLRPTHVEVDLGRLTANYRGIATAIAAPTPDITLSDYGIIQANGEN